MAKEVVSKSDWIAPDSKRQIKDNTISSIFDARIKTNKEREKLKYVEDAINATNKSFIYNHAIWSKLFEDKELPSSNDWLWSNENDKLGQSFSDWFKITKRFPNNSQCKIGLMPIGNVDIINFNINNKTVSLMELLSELVSIFFGLETKILKKLPIKTTQNDDENESKISSKTRSNNIQKGIINTRIFSGNDILQLQTGSIFDILQNKMYDNHQLFVIMGSTLIDLYPNEYYNFVYGQARINDGIGVFSFARYINGFYDLSPVEKKKNNTKTTKKKSRWPQVSQPKLSKKAIKRRERLKFLRKLLNGDKVNKKEYNQIFEKEEDKIDFLRSCAKVLTHEICHLFGIKHCIYFQCRMNGANHQKEFDSQPFYICPLCLHKLYISRSFQIKYDKKNNNKDKDKDKVKDETGDDEKEYDGNDKMKLMRQRMAKRNRQRKQNENVEPFDLMKRYKKLQEWCLKTGLIKEAEWYKQRISLVEINDNDE